MMVNSLNEWWPLKEVVADSPMNYNLSEFDQQVHRLERAVDRRGADRGEYAVPQTHRDIGKRRIYANHTRRLMRR